MRAIGNLFIIDDIVKNPFCNDYEFKGGVVENDVVYCDDAPELLKADIYYLSSTAKKRVFINVHGGGWITGDKKWRVGFASILADRGIFVMNINYGLAPQYKFEDMVKQVFFALDFIYRNAEKYNLDVNRIFMGGDSAGAHLSAVVGAIQNDRKARAKFGIADSNARVFGVALLCGVYDIEKTFKFTASHGVFYDLTGYKRKELGNYPFKREISPVGCVSKDYPRTLLVSAKLDAFAAGQDEQMAKALDKNKVKNFRFVSNDVFAADHCFFLRYRQQNSALVYDMLEDFILDDDFVV